MTYADIKFQGDFYLRVCRGKENLGDGYLSIQEWPAAAGGRGSGLRTLNTMDGCCDKQQLWVVERRRGGVPDADAAVTGRQKQSGA